MPVAMIVWSVIAGAAILILMPVDQDILDAIRDWPPLWRDFFWSLSDLGNSFWFFLYLIPAGLGCWLLSQHVRSAKRRLLFLRATLIHGYLTLAVAVSGLVVNIIKQIVGRPRPGRGEDLVEWHRFAFDSDYASFPSGHANTLFALVFALAFLWPPKGRYLPLFVILFSIALGGAMARVVSENHYMSDIVGGALVAYFTTYGLKQWLDRSGYWQWQSTKGTRL